MNYFTIALNLPAYRRRRRAFHEAGHLWAAQHFGVSIGNGTLDNPAPFDLWDHELWSWIALGGPLTETLSLTVDMHSIAGGDLNSALGRTAAAFSSLVLSQPSHCTRREGFCVEGTRLSRSHVRMQLGLIPDLWTGINGLACDLIVGQVDRAVVARFLAGRSPPTNFRGSPMEMRADRRPEVAESHTLGIHVGTT